MISKRVLFIAAALLAVSATSVMAAEVDTANFTVGTLQIGATDTLNLNSATSWGIATVTSTGTINDYLKTGYAGGAWTGLGIRSSVAAGQSGLTTLGINSGTDYLNFNTKFYGHTVVGSDTLVKYTYTGDFNLDGVVDDNDLGILINNYNQDSKGNTLNTPGNYAGGDVNYDGVINDDDLGAFINNYPSAAQGLPPLNVGQFSAAAAAHVVPEPSTIVMLIMGFGITLVAFARKHFSR